MDDISISLDDTAFSARLQRLPDLIRARLITALDSEAYRLQARVKEKLSGEVLKNQTGRLRRSINVESHDTGDTLVRTVGTNVRYARAHEYGFTGTVDVREHTRRITQAFGRPIPPRDVIVRAHTMKMNLPERSFLRSALRERAPSIRDAIVAAVKGAIE